MPFRAGSLGGGCGRRAAAESGEKARETHYLPPVKKGGTLGAGLYKRYVIRRKLRRQGVTAPPPLLSPNDYPPDFSFMLGSAT